MTWCLIFLRSLRFLFARFVALGPGGGGVLLYMSYIGMCRSEGYGFQRVCSRIGYKNQRVLV